MRPSHTILDTWQKENERIATELSRCLTDRNCNDNQTSVVLISSKHWTEGLYKGRRSGENIWCFAALEEMHYSVLFAPTIDDIVDYWERYPDNVRVIIADGDQIIDCVAQDWCLKNEANPGGIPLWRLFAFHFWAGPMHPLGRPWTLSPENFPVIYGNQAGHTYIGYSVERTCMEHTYTPAAMRPRQVYVLAKDLSYFYESKFSWDNGTFERLSARLNVEFVAGISNDTRFPSEWPAGIRNLGVLKPTEFYEQLGKSRALLGIGRPSLSPSPWDALCLGVPFINPVREYNPKNPQVQWQWQSQHDALKYVKEPYNYNVFSHDEEGLAAALSRALDTPIERYIPTTMMMESLKIRIGAFVEKDWFAEAQTLLNQRILNGEEVCSLFGLTV
ncbi:hypothetical protein FISHEDRAFT_52233 [Fistulina hepatica ATCC 64428]|nr:hypothetical protein FISHEDRAFT_52233 [Fistulina hepatica ATCC 64428]